VASTEGQVRAERKSLVSVIPTVATLRRREPESWSEAVSHKPDNHTEPEVAVAAKVSPKTKFDEPLEVVADPSLSVPEKAAALDQWEADEIALQTADDEGMAGGSEPDKLDDVNKAKTLLEKTSVSPGIVIELPDGTLKKPGSA
jgi:hypothetical protein